MYLTKRSVSATGTDAWSWDAPFSYTAEKVKETGDWMTVTSYKMRSMQIGNRPDCWLPIPRGSNCMASEREIDLGSRISLRNELGCLKIVTRAY